MTTTRLHRVSGLVVAATLALSGALLGSAQATPSTVAPTQVSADAASQQDGWTASKTLARSFVNADGSTYAFPSHKVTVSVDKTHNLHGRQRVLVQWKGAQPSGARASNPYGENGLLQEYPVVILQCRGTDDPSLPAAKQVTPQTCFTTSVAERSQINTSESDAAWTHDLFADPADKARVSGITPFPSADVCPSADTPPYYTRLTPFVAAKGTVFPACDAAHMPPEAAVGAAFPPAELAAFTDADGTGSVQYEVRSNVENESLSCSHTVACTIEVIPIVGLSCDQPSSPPTASDQACRKGGQFLPGSSNFAGQGIDRAVGPALWWSASNWRNRFSIPITFGLPPDACDVLDPRDPTAFYGSELLAQAALQWAPAYCLNQQRFKFQMNQMSDAAGWNLMETGDGVAAEVSSAHPLRGTDPVGYAPTAISGFSIGYVIDKPNNAGEYTRLKLDARLIAKLLTQSYLGSDLGRGHPGIGANALSLASDPEFIKLNPGLSQNDQEAAATVLSLSDNSDVISQLTDYIAHDKAAMAWVDGKPDPWGMKVNPSYKKISLPTAEWPLLDTYIPQTQNVCRQKNPAVYFSQLAAPVSTLATISSALLDAWPNVQTRCDLDPSTGQYKLGRIDRQSFGSRFMLGVVSLGDAARYGLRSAALETRPGTFVAPTKASLASAVKLSTQDKQDDPFVLDQKDVRTSGSAYPGTMVVYTAARTSHLAKADAAKVAQFIRVSTTEGQKPGSGNGNLPDGFLPITDHGVTKKLFASAQVVAKAISAQVAQPSDGPPTNTTSTPPTHGHQGTGPRTVTDNNPPVSLPSDAPSDTGPSSASPTSAPTKPGATSSAAPTSAPPMPPTQAASSGLARGLLPTVLLLGLGALVVSTATRFLVRPPRGRP